MHNIAGYDPEARVWITGEKPFDTTAFTEATAKAGATGVFRTEPTTGRLMNRPSLEREAAAPQRLLTIGTTGAAGRAAGDRCPQWTTWDGHARG